jgi:hypothetical protein
MPAFPCQLTLSVPGHGLGQVNRFGKGVAPVRGARKENFTAVGTAGENNFLP